MDSPIIPAPPVDTDGIDVRLEPGANTNAFHEETMVCPNCARLQQKSTNAANGNHKDAARPSFALPKPTGLDVESDIESRRHIAKPKALETVLVSRVEAQHIGTIKIIHLRRPHAKNAISLQMVRELGNEIEEIHRETCDDGTSTRALIIASAADNVFCGGADLKERATMTLPDTRSFLSGLRNVLYRLSTLPVPTIACVSGAALGGGLELALACHLRVFARNAAMGLPETRLAIIPGAGGTYRLPGIVGTSRALDMILTGRRVLADEALAIGLCHRLVATDEGTCSDPEAQRLAALDAGIALARQITSAGPVAVRAALSVLGGAQDALENAAYEAVLNTEDRNEALQAFLEKRVPVFQGR
jgi:methylglutaconyl-CoA hydratase